MNVELVTVGNPGNPADTTTGAGSVGYVYKIGKYEVKISEYAEFLNAKAKSDPYGLWHIWMSDGSITGIGRSGSSGSYSYTIIGSGNRPIGNVSWFDAARFVNWLHNGQGDGSTETGVYHLNGASSGTNFPVQPGARFWIPTDNEWYKAAYHDPTKSGNPYWLYPTRHDNVPSNSLQDGGNNANFYFNGTSTLNGSNRGTECGAFSSSGSYYQTFDQGGNVWEWNSFVNGSNRGARGGAFSYTEDSLRSTGRTDFSTGTQGSFLGFRVAAASGPQVIASTLPATGITTTGGVLNGTVNADGVSTTVTFQYGLTTSYGNTVTATPSSVGGTLTTPVSATLAGLPPTGLTYHYRVVATSPAGSFTGEDMTMATTYPLGGPVAIDYVNVGNPFNPADSSTGYGSVAAAYKIGKFETTVGQYAKFLNAVAKADPYGLYNPNLGTDMNVAGISRSGSSGAYTYAVIGSGNHPVSYVTWFNAARFANWIHNGQGSGSTETGAYTLNGATSGVFARNSGARAWLPSENEWYKAAYHKGASGGYWRYATQSDNSPGNVIGTLPNQANHKVLGYAVGQSSNYSSTLNYLTDAGAFSGSASPYGTFDQNGSVAEFTDTAVSSTFVVYRGGQWSGSPVSKNDRYTGPTNSGGWPEWGFRMAGLYEAVPAVATTLAPSSLTSSAAVLSGSVNANGIEGIVTFEYGPTSYYGSSVAAVPSKVSGSTTTAVGFPMNQLVIGQTIHYRVLVTKPNGTVAGADMVFTVPSDNANLTDLRLDAAQFIPTFDKNTPSYIATVPASVPGLRARPFTEHSGATVRVNGITVASGTDSPVLPLSVGNNSINPVVTAQDGTTTKSYVVTVTRLPAAFVFNSATDVPVRADGFTTGGLPVTPTLNYSPQPGTILTMVENTGTDFIEGRFANLAQGQKLTLNHGGKGYDFVVNYFGGTGNDLVLQWADADPLAWGSNSSGQLGDHSSIDRQVAISVDSSGVLAGKTLTALAGGYLHSLALASDGKLAAWGDNVFGQLGNNGSQASNVPIPVDTSGALAGKTVIAIAAGPFHNLALCSDGTLAAWGYNNHGQLGTGDKATRRIPVLVPPNGALAGKRIVGLAAGAYQSFALCSDGTLAAWGYNDEGELGDGTVSGSSVPLAVNRTGALAGRKVAAVAAGQYHTLALCADGTLVSWGYNKYGQLGNNSTVSSKVPVLIGTAGALSGKRVTAISAGQYHSLVLCSDGSVVSWGLNNYGQLGVSGVSSSSMPLRVDLAGFTSANKVLRISTGSGHSLVFLSDGTLVGWGNNGYGQLGNNGGISGALPSMVDTSALESGARFMWVGSGPGASHVLALAASPAPQIPALSMIGGAGSVSAGSADADDDHDGISNLAESAFGLDPSRNSAGELPALRLTDEGLVIEFTEPAGVTGFTYGAEWSESLLPGSWTEIPDSGVAPGHVFRMPSDQTKRGFVRLKVSRQ